MRVLALLLPLALACAASFADATPNADAQDVPASKGLLNSYDKRDLSAGSPTLVGGVLVTIYPAATGIHVICSKRVFDANAAALGPYKDADQTNLQDVYAGDDPAHPAWTVSLTFPDQATLDSVATLLAAP